jgi:hypothetical protein
MYNDQKPRRGFSNLFSITTKRLTMKGLIVSDWLDRQAEFQHEVGEYLRAGTLKSKETLVSGIDQAVSVLGRSSVRAPFDSGRYVNPRATGSGDRSNPAYRPGRRWLGPPCRSKPPPTDGPRIQLSGALLSVTFSRAVPPGCSVIRSDATLPDSTQIIVVYSSSPKSGIALAFAVYGFHTSVEREPAFSVSEPAAVSGRGGWV